MLLLRFCQILFSKFPDVLPTWTCKNAEGDFCSICFGGNILIPIPWVVLLGT